LGPGPIGFIEPSKPISSHERRVRTLRYGGPRTALDRMKGHGTVVGDMLRGLAARFPWRGGRLDLDLPALALSLTVHGLMLVGLAFAGYQVHREGHREFRSELLDNLVASESTYQDLDQTTAPMATVPAAGSFAPMLSTTITSAPSTAGGIPVSAAP